jgi:hypothetical protein
MDNRKRSLSQTGGKVRLAGDPATSEILGRCLTIDRKAPLPFTHGFHAYPARMHPETARQVVEAFPGGKVLDPFMGSGTVALEAVRAGRAFLGFDIVGPALEIAWARTRVWHPDQCRAFEKAALGVAERAWSDSEASELSLPAWTMQEREWYDPHTLREVGALYQRIQIEDDPFRRLMKVVLSSLLVRLSRQVSDSMVKMDIYHRAKPRHATFRWFREKVAELTKGLLQLSSNLYKRKIAFVEPELKREDARQAVVAKGSADLLLTSPPYAGTYDYTWHQDRRYGIFNSDKAFPVMREIGSRRSQGRGYVADLKAVLARMSPGMSAAGKMILQIGDGLVGETPVKADEVMPAIAAELGWFVAAGASQHRRDYSGGPDRREHLLLLERKR